MGHLAATRDSYDVVAVDYAEQFGSRMAGWPVGRALLGAFAELVLDGGGGVVADVGCGPGWVTAHLEGLGVSAFGVDLSPKMVELAREAYPGLRFEVGSMTALDIRDGELGGVLAWWSILHIPPDELPGVFGEFHRVLAAGGQLLMGFHVGDERLRPERAYGHPVTYEAYRLPVDRVAELLERAGFAVTAQLSVDAEIRGEKRPQACLLARRSAMVG